MTESRAQISVEPFTGTVTVKFSDAVIASTDEAQIAREENRDPVFYIPFEDIYFEFLWQSDTTAYHPSRGSASYWNVEAVGEAASDVMWSYENPHEDLRNVADHGAFDPSKVIVEAASPDSPRRVPELP